MMKFEKITTTLILILTMITFASGADFTSYQEVETNTSYLNGSFHKNITYYENSTLNITENKTSPGLTLDHPGSLVFNQSNSSIFYTIYHLQTNHSGIYNATLDLKDHDKNNSFQYAMTLNVTLNITTNTTNTTNTSTNTTNTTTNTTNTTSNETYIDYNNFSISILNENYFLNLSTNVLPKTGSLDFNLEGERGLVNMTCHDWLDCPSQVNFTKDEKNIAVDYTIPQYNVSKHNLSINFTRENYTRQTRVIVNIHDPVMQISSYKWGSDCFTEDGNVKYDCIEEYEEYQIERLHHILKSAREEAEECNCTNNTVVEKEYIMSGDISKQVKESLTKCRNDLDNCRQDYSQCTDQVENVSQSLQAVRNKNIENKSEILEESFHMTRSKVEEAKKTKSRAWTIVILTVIFVILGIVGWHLYNKKKKYNWRL